MTFTHATKAGPVKVDATKKVLKSEKGLSSSDAVHEEIKARAQKIYQGRNGGTGNSLSDWLQAEKEVRKTEKFTHA